MAKILAPNKQYNGISAGVAFTNGTGESDNPVLLDWFKDKGYEVEEPEEPEPEDNLTEGEDGQDEPPTVPESDEDQEDNQEPQLEELNAEELTDYAKDHGIDIGRATSKDGILAKIKEA